MQIRHCLLAAAAFAAIAPATLAQQAAGYQPPRTADGKPDLQGVWTNVSLTVLERPQQFKELVIPQDVATKIEQARADGVARAGARTDPNSGAPVAGRDVGGYNQFWIDSGSHYAKINGEVRSSWLVDPPNGRLPYSPEGRAEFEKNLRKVADTYDGPETRSMAERCLVGFGSTGGPPMINVMYNNLYEFVQTPEHLVINVEMNHDARIVALKSEGGKTPRWLGNSKGHWEGDTLVVETTNFNPGESLRTFFATNASFMMSPDAKVTERFTRKSDDQIFYEFSVDDPKLYSQVWRAEMVLNKTPQRLYEYACHEGNYALPGILSGAREAEKLGVKVKVDRPG